MSTATLPAPATAPALADLTCPVCDWHIVAAPHRGRIIILAGDASDDALTAATWAVATLDEAAPLLDGFLGGHLREAHPWPVAADRVA